MMTPPPLDGGQKAVVLFSRDTGHGLEPMGEMGSALFHRPVLHGVCDDVGGLTGEGASLFDTRLEFPCRSPFGSLCFIAESLNTILPYTAIMVSIPAPLFQKIQRRPRTNVRERLCSFVLVSTIRADFRFVKTETPIQQLFPKTLPIIPPDSSRRTEQRTIDKAPGIEA